MTSTFAASVHLVRVGAILLMGLLLGVVVYAIGDASPASPAPFAVDNLPSPLCINGNPIQACIGSDSSIQVRHNRWAGGQVYGWQNGDADSGVWLWTGGDIYGPDACYSGRTSTKMSKVHAWTTMNHSGPTGSGAVADPWIITTVLQAGSSGVRVTQRLSYVNGQDYFRLTWDVVNASDAATTVNLFHAVDSYLADTNYGFGYYDAGSGAVGGSDEQRRWYMLFVPETPATAYNEGWYWQVWQGIGYCGDNQSCSPIDCSQGIGFTNQIDSNAIDNGFGLQWRRSIGAGAVIRLGDWWTFGGSPLIPSRLTPTPTSTPSRTITPTATRTATAHPHGDADPHAYTNLHLDAYLHHHPHTHRYS